MGNIVVSTQKLTPAIDYLFSFQDYLLYKNVLTTAPIFFSFKKISSMLL